jgi:hypothetical protein
LRTRQITLNADSTVIIVITDVTNRMIIPSVVSPFAFDANWFRYLKIWLLT